MLYMFAENQTCNCYARDMKILYSNLKWNLPYLILKIEFEIKFIPFNFEDIKKNLKRIGFKNV